MNDPYAKKYIEKGIPFDEWGYPRMEDYAIKKVEFRLSSNRTINFKKANDMFGLSNADLKAQNLVWHEMEDEKTMVLVKKYINNPRNGGPNHRGIISILDSLSKACT